MNFRNACIYAVLFVSIFAPATFAQTATPGSLAANVEERRLASRLMGREMPYRVVLPKNYSAKRHARYPVIYLLHGYGGSYKNWTDLTGLEEYSLPYDVIVVTPEGENGWYVDQSGAPNRNYESYIVKELIPEIDAKFRTSASREKRVIAGLSMGGYGALKFGLKYPEMFAMAGSMSGAVSASSYRKSEDLPPGLLRTVLVPVFGEPGSAMYASNDLFKIVREASPETVRSWPFLYIDCGTEDFLFHNSREFVEQLVGKKVPHEYRQLPGAHDWKYWDRQVQELLRVASAKISGN